MFIYELLKTGILRHSSVWPRTFNVFTRTYKWLTQWVWTDAGWRRRRWASRRHRRRPGRTCAAGPRPTVAGWGPCVASEPRRGGVRTSNAAESVRSGRWRCAPSGPSGRGRRMAHAGTSTAVPTFQVNRTSTILDRRKREGFRVQLPHSVRNFGRFTELVWFSVYDKAINQESSIRILISLLLT